MKDFTTKPEANQKKENIFNLSQKSYNDGEDVYKNVLAEEQEPDGSQNPEANELNRVIKKLETEREELENELINLSKLNNRLPFKKVSATGKRV